ncbi:hypothetical protein [Streptomyces sp. CB01881]|nr:hypothetical protein [Streptomyces sp. CB01881]
MIDFGTLRRALDHHHDGEILGYARTVLDQPRPPSADRLKPPSAQPSWR